MNVSQIERGQIRYFRTDEVLLNRRRLGIVMTRKRDIACRERVALVELISAADLDRHICYSHCFFAAIPKHPQNGLAEDFVALCDKIHVLSAWNIEGEPVGSVSESKMEMVLLHVKDFFGDPTAGVILGPRRQCNHLEGATASGATAPKPPLDVEGIFRADFGTGLVPDGM